MPDINKIKQPIWHKEGAQVGRYFLNVALPLHKMIEHIQYTMGCPNYAKAQQNERIIQNSKVVNQIQIINGLEKGNITRTLKGERVQRLFLKDYASPFASAHPLHPRLIDSVPQFLYALNLSDRYSQ